LVLHISIAWTIFNQGDCFCATIIEFSIVRLSMNLFHSQGRVEVVNQLHLLAQKMPQYFLIHKERIMISIATTRSRVSSNTAQKINERIACETQKRVALCAEKGRKAINRRLRELDEEWDIERAIEAVASSAMLTGLILSLTVNRRFLLFPAAIATFLLQHAVQGWCPPIPVLRQLGFRTADEISEERFALKSLRGDFRDVPPSPEIHSHASADEAIQAALR
jgi:hypothetical protein